MVRVLRGDERHIHNSVLSPYDFLCKLSHSILEHLGFSYFMVKETEVQGSKICGLGLHN